MKTDFIMSSATSPPVPPRVRLVDIAKSCGVSKGTVSLALRDSPLIAPATKAHVRERASAMGYRPDPSLRKLASYRWKHAGSTPHGTLALIAPSNSKLLLDLREPAAALGYQVEGFDPAEYRVSARLAEVLIARGIEGVIVPPWNDLSYFEAFPWSQFSSINLFGGPTQPRLHTVRHDAFGNLLALQDRILQSGSKRVGVTVVTEKGQCTPTDKRMIAASHYLASEVAGMPEFVRPFGIDIANFRETQEWVRECKVDLLITPGAFVGNWLMQAGFEVPQSLRVIVMNLFSQDRDWAGFIRNDAQIARRAVGWLDRMIVQDEKGEASMPETLVVPGTWRGGRSFPECTVSAFQIRKRQQMHSAR